ncbi:hypothetical protein ACJMK2_037874 [Sinanodonta woodiana]|uniref:Uncharacterized protein n=1 Tax=Sinanodonta woodiana TaxID=1069815 RepID=A0ABD3WLS5_SINWO
MKYIRYSLVSTKYILYTDVLVMVLLITTCRSGSVLMDSYYVTDTNNYTHTAHCSIDNPGNLSLPDIHIQFNVTTTNFSNDNLDIKYSPDGSEICAQFKSWITQFLDRIDFRVTVPFPAVGGNCTGVKQCQGIGFWNTTEISPPSSQQPSEASMVTSSADVVQETTAVVLTVGGVQQSTLTTPCFCTCQEMLLSSKLQTKNATGSMMSANMTVDKKSTSKWIRTKISAEDSRTSSLSIGCAAVLVLVFSAACIVLPDMAIFLRLLWKKCR